MKKKRTKILTSLGKKNKKKTKKKTVLVNMFEI